MGNPPPPMVCKFVFIYLCVPGQAKVLHKISIAVILHILLLVKDVTIVGDDPLREARRVQLSTLLFCLQCQNSLRRHPEFF